MNTLNPNVFYMNHFFNIWAIVAQSCMLILHFAGGDLPLAAPQNVQFIHLERAKLWIFKSLLQRWYLICEISGQDEEDGRSKRESAYRHSLNNSYNTHSRRCMNSYILWTNNNNGIHLKMNPHAMLWDIGDATMRKSKWKKICGYVPGQYGILLGL